MQALSALTPPLLVCAVVIIAIVAFLRHEMRRARTGRRAPGDEGEMRAEPSSADPDNEQNATDALDSRRASRPLGEIPSSLHSSRPDDR
jgi:hypothetical protein